MGSTKETKDMSSQKSAEVEGASTSASSNGTDTGEYKKFGPKNLYECPPAPQNGFAITEYRLELTKSHRDLMQSMNKSVADGELDISRIIEQHFPLCGASGTTPQKPFLPRVPAKLKPILLSDMAKNADKMFYRNYIHLNVIEDPITAFSGTTVLFQDDKGDVERGVVYCVKMEEVAGKLGFGSRITLLNPYMRIGADFRPAIRVDDNKGVIFHTQYTDRTKCRFCSKPNATLKCARCLRAFYCDKECQTSDWQTLKHKRVCNFLKLA